jgi:hypothetical protein
MTPHKSAGDSAGARTSGAGTPVAVDVSADRRARVALAAFLGGPLSALIHFMLVYLVVEAGCTGDGPGLRSFDPPVPKMVTLVATALAAAACFGFAAWNLSRWRERRRDESDQLPDRSDLEAPDPGGSLALSGLLLALLSFVTILLVGLPTLFLSAC